MNVTVCELKNRARAFQQDWEDQDPAIAESAKQTYPHYVSD
jgi:hypothetical protein